VAAAAGSSAEGRWQGGGGGMTRGEFKRRVDAVTRSCAAQQAIVAAQTHGWISIVKGRAFKAFTYEEMAWIIFIASEPGTVYDAMKIAERNSDIIFAIALALEHRRSVEVRWFRGQIRFKLFLSEDLIEYLAGDRQEMAA
jgi:hypothetical protein